VPLMEEENAWSALQNNIVGTCNAATAAAEAGVGRFVLISTDKAVNPTSVMGASKRAAEMVLSQLATRGHRTIFVSEITARSRSIASPGNGTILNTRLAAGSRT